MGRPAHGLPSPTRTAQRRGRCASSPGAAAAAQPTERSRAAAPQRPTCHQGSAADDWRGGRAAGRWLRSGTAAASTSLHPAFSGPAAGVAGDRGGDLAGAAPSGAQRSDLQAGQFAKRDSFTRSVKESGPAFPGHGKGPPRASAGNAGLTVWREGWKPVGGETQVPRRLDAQRDSPAPRNGDTPGPNGTWRRCRSRQHHNLRHLEDQGPSSSARHLAGRPFRELRARTLTASSSTHPAAGPRSTPPCGSLLAVGGPFRQGRSDARERRSSTRAAALAASSRISSKIASTGLISRANTPDGPMSIMPRDQSPVS